MITTGRADSETRSAHTVASSTTTRTSPDLPAAEIVERITDEAIAIMRSLNQGAATPRPEGD